MENMKKLNIKYFITKILISTKLPNRIRKTRVLKLVFKRDPVLSFGLCVSVNSSFFYFASLYSIFYLLSNAFFIVELKSI